jgi:hypothetical protein
MAGCPRHPAPLRPPPRNSRPRSPTKPTRSARWSPRPTCAGRRGLRRRIPSDRHRPADEREGFRRRPVRGAAPERQRPRGHPHRRRLPLREARVAPRRRGARTRQLHLPRRARSSRCSRTRCRAGCARSSKPRTAWSKTVICEFTPDARLVRSEFANSVIRSVKRLTYKQAYAFLRHLTKEQIRALPARAAPPDRLAGPPARRTHRRRTGPRPGHDRRPLEHRQGAPRRTLPRRVASTWR